MSCVTYVIYDNHEYIHQCLGVQDVEFIAGFLDQGCDPNQRSWKTGFPLIIEATELGRLDVVKLLVERGADVDQCAPGSYQRAVHFAAMEGMVEIAESLLVHGADVSRALHAAASSGRVNVAEALLARGADVNEKSPHGGTPLICAVDGGHVEMVKLLLSHGANVNWQGGSGATALHMAAGSGNAPITEVLLDHGADPTLEYYGRRVEGGSEEVRSLLAGHEAAR